MFLIGGLLRAPDEVDETGRLAGEHERVELRGEKVEGVGVGVDGRRGGGGSKKGRKKE